MIDLQRQQIGTRILLFADFVFDCRIESFNRDGQAVVALDTGHPDLRPHHAAVLIGCLKLNLDTPAVSSSHPNRIVQGGRVQFLVKNRYVIQTLDVQGCTIEGPDGSWSYEVF
jgi:hypothetical protein